MSSKLKGGLSEKVDEIKRMQANWLRERSRQKEEGRGKQSDETHSSDRKSRDNGTRKSTQQTKKGSDAVSWVVSGGSKKKTVAPTSRQTLRTRSASPARNTSKSSRTDTVGGGGGKKSISRPSNAKSSDGSRPPSGRTSSSRSEKSSRVDKERKQTNNIGVAEERTISNVSDGLRTPDRWDPFPQRVSSEPNLHRLQRSEEDVCSRVEKQDVDGNWGDVKHQHHHQQDQDSCSGAEHTSRSNAGQSLQSRIQTDQSESSDKQASLMNPDAFDRLADQIASRVKAEMREERHQLMNRAGFPSKSIVFDDDGGDDDTDSRIAGHHCSKCKQLMVPPDHSPMILVPCGHTFCEACAEDRIKCPTCRARVTSTSSNTTLQDVLCSSRPTNQKRHSNPTHHQTLTNHISRDHVNHSYASQPANHELNHRTPDYAPAKYADEGQIHARTGVRHDHQNLATDDVRTSGRDFVDSDAKVDKRVVSSKRRITPEEEARKLEEEYQSLGIRCEALESEEMDVLQRVERKNREMAQQKQQTTNISQQQQRLRDEIKGLEERIAALEHHRLEYKRQVEDVEDRKKEELDHLAMVRTMLRDMQRNRERVKMSARKLNVSLD